MSEWHRYLEFDMHSSAPKSIQLRQSIVAQDMEIICCRALSDAFRDLGQLMSKAEEMVSLAQYFKDRAAGPGPEGGDMDAETALDLYHLGLVTPVTKEAAGRKYHRQLAEQARFLKFQCRVTLHCLSNCYTWSITNKQPHLPLQRTPLLQLATFLEAPLQRAGGVLPLSEVYCLYNRARGLELISPDDLLSAVKHLSVVGASLEVRP